MKWEFDEQKDKGTEKQRKIGSFYGQKNVDFGTNLAKMSSKKTLI